MTDNEKILSALYRAVDDVNQQQPEGRKLEKSPETLLYGKGAVLDSLGLVTLVVSAEQMLDEDFGRTVTLANEKAFSQKNSPFRTIGTLAEYVATLLGETGA